MVSYELRDYSCNKLCDFKNSRIRVDVAYVQENKGQLFKQTLAWVFNETAF